MRQDLTVAVDVGGTFTDLVAYSHSTKGLFRVKVRSTPRRPELGFIEAFKKLFEEYGVSPGDVSLTIHVNTVGTNLFRGQLGLEPPKTALITTQGFRDVLEIGRQNRAELYNIFYRRPAPLVPREMRFEVGERVDSRGHVLKEPSQEELNRLVDVLKKEHVESVAISFLNSYINPSNENLVKNILSSSIDIPVHTSYEVDPEHREYERTSTTVVNAVLAPVVARYITAIRKMLREIGVGAPVQIMSSSGGLVDIDEAVTRPVACIESGPAAGVIGASELAKSLGHRKVISLDMGGTTAKAGVVVDGRPAYVPEMEVGGYVHMGRVVKGSGYPVRFPSVDLAEVSAGGGTVIDVDEAGSLKVGPLSAGSDPGPVCYGQGGTMPTITDANLILNRLEHLLGGGMKLDRDLAVSAMERVAERAGLNAVECSRDSLVLANLQMARAIHIVTLERGLDPSEFVLYAFGGAGPLHAAELAIQTGVNTVVIPPHPGLFSSLGLLMTDMRYTYVKGVVKVLDKSDEASLEDMFKELESTALFQLGKRGIDLGKAYVSRSIDLRYYGQGYEIEVEAERPLNLKNCVTVFEERHEATYGYRHAGEPVEVTALRVTVTVQREKAALAKPAAEGRPRKKMRKVYFEDGRLDTPVYLRDDLPAGFELEGPAVIEEYDSTTVVPPGWRLSVDGTGCMVMWR
jgi:N-methylhydantoinase A